MENTTYQVQARTATGKNVRRLRRGGIVPGNVFGPEVESLAVQMDQIGFTRLFNAAGETELINLQIEGEQTPRTVLIDTVQLEPVTHAPMHVDFFQVNLKETVEVQVPIEFINEAPVVKEKGGILVTLLDELTIKALPTQIPKQIELDISVLGEIGDTITVGDIILPEGSEVLDDPTGLVVKVEEMRVEEVVEEVVADAETTEAASGAEGSTEVSEGDTVSSEEN